MSDFMTCSERFNIQSKGSISQLWNTVGRYNLVYLFTRHSYTSTQSVNNVTLEWFVTCIKRYYNQCGSISQLWNIVGR